VYKGNTSILKAFCEEKTSYRGCRCRYNLHLFSFYVQLKSFKLKYLKHTFSLQENGQLSAVLSCLTGRQISEACVLAQTSGNPRLALLLGQAVSNYMPRQMISKQLEEYIELGVGDKIERYIM